MATITRESDSTSKVIRYPSLCLEAIAACEIIGRERKRRQEIEGRNVKDGEYHGVIEIDGVITQGVEQEYRRKEVNKDLLIRTLLYFLTDEQKTKVKARLQSTSAKPLKRDLTPWFALVTNEIKGVRNGQLTGKLDPVCRFCSGESDPTTNVNNLARESKRE